MATDRINVNQDGCRAANANTTLETQGLDTCIGIVAFGLPAAQGGINKVMAHSSTGRVSQVIGGSQSTSFVQQVRNSGMQVTGICMSCPRHDRNDHGPGKISDETIRQAIASRDRIQPSQVTAQQIETFRDGFRVAFRLAEQEAVRICIDNFGIGPVTIRRDNNNVQRPPPYGTLVATKSPRGQVKAEGQKMADIPDPVAQAAAPATGHSSHHSGSHSSGYGGSSSGQGGYPASSSKPSGYSGSSSRPSGYPASSSKPSGYSASSSKPSGSSTSSKPSGGSSKRGTTKVVR
ncbi:hypothetical protein C8A03DRAFT_39413 [Achaetomium macrosporum]|uniref:Uncharacterized protein n=1 Tax=Achaetomium macrosporum TaxID=79813 RepID=A0AAN7H312_9PEZI|nr:hypothetical protein C8A03DRAFT_39413 [Achaetomium macrosporum]